MFLVVNKIRDDNDDIFSIIVCSFSILKNNKILIKNCSNSIQILHQDAYVGKGKCQNSRHFYKKIVFLLVALETILLYIRLIVYFYINSLKDCFIILLGTSFILCRRSYKIGLRVQASK